MSHKFFHALSMATFSLFFFSVSLATATESNAANRLPEQGSVEINESVEQYHAIYQEVVKNMGKLEELGGGMKPLKNYLQSIDQNYKNGQEKESLNRLVTFNQSISQQLDKAKQLRAKKSLRAKTFLSIDRANHTTSITSQEPACVLINAFNQAQQKIELDKNSSSPVTNFRGTADDYLKLVVKDIVSKELGDVSLPCNGPFRLERFRIAKRISELKRSGRSVKNFLSYYNKTEQIAQYAKGDPGRIAELGGNVRYLSQQLQLPPLTGSLNTRVYR